MVVRYTEMQRTPSAEAVHGPAGQNWTLNANGWCVRPDCTATKVRNSFGICIKKPVAKEGMPDSCAAAASQPTTHNPISIGTGSKYWQEKVYASLGGINFTLNYTSRKPVDNYQPSLSMGTNWINSYEARINPNGTSSNRVAPGAVSVLRPNGQLFGYTLSGNAYVTDADTSHLLTRLIDSESATIGWQLVDSRTGTIERYDAAGQLQSLTEPSGKSQTLAYDDSGRLSSVIDSQGRVLTLIYDGNNRVSTLIQPDGAHVQFAYDGQNNLSAIIWPDTKTRTYLYEDSRFPNTLTGIIDENRTRYTTYGYDANGRAVIESLAGGVATTLLAFGSNSTTVTDALNSVRTYNFQPLLSLTKSTGVSQPGGSGCSASSSALTYDVNGNIASRTDFNGVRTSYAYDLTRNLETSRVEAVGKPEARTTSTQWHTYWRLPTQLAEPKKRITWVYNGDGGVFCAPQSATVPSITGGTQPIGVVCSKTEQATTEANGSLGLGATVVGTPRTWTYTYNQYGQVLTADGPRTDVADVTTTTYYDTTDPDLGKRGNVATITNALRQVTQFTTYDLNGNPLTIIDPNGVITTLTYDLRQHLTSRTVGGETTTYQYDAVGQLLKITLPDGRYTAYTYDPAHRLTAIADALGNSITYTLDAMGNRTKEEIKDPAGQLARTRSRIFDALSRLAQDIGAQGQVTRYEYDANGNRTKVTNPLNQVTVSTYDPLNRLIQVTDPGLGQTRYSWDGQDRLAQVTDPRNLATTYTVDGLGNQQTLQSPDTGSSTSTYDAAGNELTRTDAKGQLITTIYDALNRPTRITYQDGSWTRYTWDLGTNGLGHLGKIDEYDASSTLLRSLQSNYDPQGRLLGETRMIGNVAHTITYSYSAGQLTGLTLPSGKRLGYTRNAAGQITQVTLTANGQTKTLLRSIAYHPFGGLKSFTDGAGQIHRRNNDKDGRTSSYTLGNQTWLLSYDAASRITGQIDASNAANSATYGYDGLDRLTNASLRATTYGYGYDATGNRTTQNAGSTTRTYNTADTSNHLQSLTNPSQTLGYDANGSLTSDGTNQYTYDPRGRLNQAITAAGTTTYQVNALGQRVRKTNSATNTDILYHYDTAGHLLAESNASGTILREYVWLDDIPVAVLQ